MISPSSFLWEREKNISNKLAVQQRQEGNTDLKAVINVECRPPEG